jgi:hypothetical protein
MTVQLRHLEVAHDVHLSARPSSSPSPGSPLVRSKRQLPGMEVEVLGAKVIDVEQGHSVAEVGVPADWEMHSAVECFVGLTVEVPV